MTFVDIYSEGVRKKVYYYTLLALITILCYGIYLPFLLKSLILIRPRIRSSVRSRWLLALIFALFISTTVHLIACLLRTATVIDFRFSFVQVLPVPTKMGIVPQLDFPAATAFYYTGSINILLVDVIVVWRAYALLPHNPKLRALLLAFLIVTLCFNVFVLIYSSDPQRYSSLSESLQSRLYIARDVMVLFVTVFGLASIWWITWVYEKAAKMSKFRARQNTTSFISRIPRALIEGCVLLALLQVATICQDFAHKGSALLFVVISEITIIASAIHPCLVTIIVLDESYSTKLAFSSKVHEADLGSFPAAPLTMASCAV